MSIKLGKTTGNRLTAMKPEQNQKIKKENQDKRLFKKNGFIQIETHLIKIQLRQKKL